MSKSFKEAFSTHLKIMLVSVFWAVAYCLVSAVPAFAFYMFIEESPLRAIYFGWASLFVIMLAYSIYLDMGSRDNE